MAPLPSLEPEIRRRVAKMEEFVPELISCHVVVDAQGGRHQQGHRYRVKIDLRVRDEELLAGDHHAGEDIEIAMHGAFDAMTRRLEDYIRQRRGQVKQHPAQRSEPPAAAEPREDSGTEAGPRSRPSNSTP